jgi:hypothetical protein
VDALGNLSASDRRQSKLARIAHLVGCGVGDDLDQRAAARPPSPKSWACRTNTARRILEDLTAYGLTERRPQGQGKPDNWTRLAWEEA